ncbi:MAG: YaiI/YqxD family protein [Candidatus Eisenbacteria bacterium]
MPANLRRMCPIPRIVIDADACPVKDEVYRVAERYELPVLLVAASWMRVPASARVSLEVVDQGFDAADDWIAERVGPGDIVVTADIPLASRCLTQGAYAISPSGRPFTESNIGDALATRELLSELRGAGEITRGPAPFQARDRSRFLQALDAAVHSLLRA